MEMYFVITLSDTTSTDTYDIVDRFMASTEEKAIKYVEDKDFSMLDDLMLVKQIKIPE